MIKQMLLLFLLGIFIVGCTQTEIKQESPNDGVPTPIDTPTDTGNGPETGVAQSPPPTETPPGNPETNVTFNMTESPNDGVPTPTGISTTELASHDSASDCWIGYKGKVYDVTAYVPKHPGGAGQITPYCGTSSEFERAFTNQHGTGKVNVLEREGIYKGVLE